MNKVIWLNVNSFIVVCMYIPEMCVILRECVCMFAKSKGVNKHIKGF